mmetsp:Transcript_43555/g.139957  ORF Transcript_43555/g.139957 Transcript_43555/m.139957 type:complete len:149 (+) Transcript_43555:1092-1538(+)
MSGFEPGMSKGSQTAFGSMQKSVVEVVVDELTVVVDVVPVPVSVDVAEDVCVFVEEVLLVFVLLDEDAVNVLVLVECVPVALVVVAVIVVTKVVETVVVVTVMVDLVVVDVAMEQHVSTSASCVHATPRQSTESACSRTDLPAGQPWL